MSRSVTRYVFPRTERRFTWRGGVSHGLPHTEACSLAGLRTRKSMPIVAAASLGSKSSSQYRLRTTGVSCP